MNQKLKYVGLLAILPLFTMALLTDYVADADAAKAKGSDGAVDPKSYGKRTANIVCGGALCSDASPNATPTVLSEISDIRV